MPPLRPSVSIVFPKASATVHRIFVALVVALLLLTGLHCLPLATGLHRTPHVGLQCCSSVISSPSLESHWQHLRDVLVIMRQHQLLAKITKCFFAQKQVEYLGHIISGEGLQTDPAKLEVVVAWPKPLSVKALRGFLGLAGYYRRFIKAYGIISKPLTDLLKKDALSGLQGLNKPLSS
nr:putative mitochondrial protein [Ipomoea batatas]